MQPHIVLTRLPTDNRFLVTPCHLWPTAPVFFTAALRVELTTAKAMAEATQQLLSTALAGHLVAHLTRLATSHKKGKTHKPRHMAALAALLTMYAEAIR